MTDRVLRRGDTFVLLFQLVVDITTGTVFSTAPIPGQPPPDTVPVNLTGWFAWLTLKQNFADPDAAAIAQVNSNVGQGIVFTNIPLGRATCTILPITTVGFPDSAVTIAYDLQVADPSGRIFTPESGTITVSPDVTRAQAPPGPPPPPPPPPIDPLLQQTWHINAITGADTNDGLTAQTALKTFGQYTTRTGGRNRPISVPVHIFIDSDLPVTDPVLLAGAVQQPTASIRLSGTPTQLRKSTLTGYTGYVQATNQWTDLVDGVLDWTPFVGKFVHFLTGAAAGCYARILKAVSPGHARVDWIAITQSTNPNFQIIFNPVIGDSYEVISLPQIQSYAEDITGFTGLFATPQALVELLRFPDALGVDGYVVARARTYYQYCDFPLVIQEEGSTILGSLIAELATGGQTSIVTCGVLNGVIFAGGHLTAFGVIFQASQIIASDGGTIHNHHNSYGWGFFDCDTPIQLSPGKMHIEAPFWGQNNTTCAVRVAGDSRVTNNLQTENPAHTIAGVGVGYQDIIWRDQTALPAFDSVSGKLTPPRVLTFANLRASVAQGGFNHQFFDPALPSSGYGWPITFGTPFAPPYVGPNYVQGAALSQAGVASPAGQNPGQALSVNAPFAALPLSLKLGASGPVQVSLSLQVTTSLAARVTIQLTARTHNVGNYAAVGPAIAADISAAGDVAISIPEVVFNGVTWPLLPFDVGGNVDIGVTVTASAGTITTSAGSGTLVVKEFA